MPNTIKLLGGEAVRRRVVGPLLAAVMAACALVPIASAAHADTSAPPVPTELQAGATDTLAPVLSGLVQVPSQTFVTGQIFLQDNSGNAVGDSPTATGEVPSGERVTYHVPEDLLTDGATYKWYMKACYQDACSAATSIRSFTVHAGGTVQTSSTATEQSATLAGSDLSINGGVADSGACSGDDCSTLPQSAVQVGGDGTHTQVSGLWVNLSKLPVRALVSTATLNLRQTDCTGCVSGATWGGTLNAFTATADTRLQTTGPELAGAADTDPVAQAPGTTMSISVDLTSTFQDWSSGTANSGLVLQADSATADSGVTYSASITVTYTAPTAPSAPVAIKALGGDTGIYVSWNAPVNVGDAGGVTGYSVQALNAAGGVVGQAYTTENTHAVVGWLTNGTSYRVSVTAVNGTGAGPAALSATVKPTAPSTGSASWVIDGADVQQFLDAKIGLQSGKYASAAAAVASLNQGSSFQAQLNAEESVDLGVHNTMVAAHEAMSNPTNSQADLLVVPAADGNTVDVYVINTLHYDALTATDTSTPSTTASGEVKDYRFTLSVGPSPVILGYVDAAQATATVDELSESTAFSPQDLLNSPSVPQAADDISSQSPSADNGTGTGPLVSAATAYWFPNRAGITNWALANAYSKNNNGYHDDCTDFASRALHKGGGMSYSGYSWHFHRKNDRYWGHDHAMATYSWGGAAHLAAYLNNIGSAWYGYLSQGAIGNIVFANWHGGPFSGIEHTGVVVKNDRGHLIVAQHSRNVVEPLSVWMNAYGGHHTYWLAGVRRRR